jgi:plasmid maintenance system antidote protein VapI
VQKQLDKIKQELTHRIHLRFMSKYKGNKLRLAKAAKCDEKTIRKLFNEGQGMTINLLFKLAYALDTTPAKLMEGLNIKDGDK